MNESLGSISKINTNKNKFCVVNCKETCTVKKNVYTDTLLKSNF